MKRKIEIIQFLVFCVLYCGGYFTVRSAYENVGVEVKPGATGNGYLQPVDYTSTEFFAPSGGIRRVWQYSLYYVFYPLGKLEARVTDRSYEITDARNIIF
jgi:hypothetical protein